MIFGEKLKEKDGEENQILCFVLEKGKIFSVFWCLLTFEIFFI